MTADRQTTATVSQDPLTFIDVFAGCGGLSLGLLNAGWSGILAIEKDPLAFKTIKHNLIESELSPKYDWPAWFPTDACSISDFNEQYAEPIRQLRGKVTLVAGGSPCQGFSLAGKRDREDERNSLYQEFIRTVDALSPTLVAMENVHAIAMPFVRSEGPLGEHNSVADEIKLGLEKLGYIVFSDLVRCQDFGVPQRRTRYFLVGIKKDSLKGDVGSLSPFTVMDEITDSFLASKGLQSTVKIAEAISDLEARWGTVDSPETPRFRQGLYGDSESGYQALLRVDRQGNRMRSGEIPDSHRFPNHASSTVDRFRQILQCRRGVQLSKEDRNRLGINKQSTTPLASDQPCHTLTTLPDDYLHYSEPRILTVREYARIQSFPDWFEFKGKYSTGGKKRRNECPRYTQAGNAVPPFASEVLGKALAEYLARALEPNCLGVEPQPSVALHSDSHSAAIQKFRSRLLEWYRLHGRRFPWRRKFASNYRKIVAEILLQRTRAETVAQFFPAFVERYPSWQQLADADREELMNFIRPIGLWHRKSTTLIELASELTKRNGRFPQERDQIEALPGVGQYIADSIMLLCHNLPSPLLDSNMARVLERYFGPRKLRDIRYDPYLQGLARAVVNCEHSVNLNWGILDLAAKVCLIGSPKCRDCALVNGCRYAEDL